MVTKAEIDATLADLASFVEGNPDAGMLAATALEHMRIMHNRIFAKHVDPQWHDNYPDGTSAVSAPTEETIIFSTADSEMLSGFSWLVDKHGYAVGYKRDEDLNLIKCHMHVMVMGGYAEGMHIDHRDGNKLNNCRNNLRRVTPSENQYNVGAKSNSKTGIKGVTEHPGGGYVATIRVDGRPEKIGHFECPVEAKLAYDAVAIVRYGALNRFQELPERYKSILDAKDAEFKAKYEAVRKSFREATLPSFDLKTREVFTN